MDDKKNIKDWEYDTEFYEEENQNKVRSFEEIAAECEELMKEPQKTNSCDNDTLNEITENIKKIRELSIMGKDILSISNELNLEREFVSNVLITITSSSDDSSDMAIAHLIMMS